MHVHLNVKNVEIFIPSYVTAELKMSGLSEVVSNLFYILIFRTDVLCAYSMALVLEVSSRGDENSTYTRA